MSCNCGCHDERTPPTGWRTFVPLIVAAAVVGVLIAGGVLKKNEAGKAADPSTAHQVTTSATR